MPEIEEPRPIWREVATRIATQLGLLTNRSPTLTATIERGVRFVAIDSKSREIVFDTRALFLGLLATGLQDPDSIHYGNTAAWFVTWLTQKVGTARVSEALSRSAMTSPEDVSRALADGYEIVLSRSVAELPEPASVLAQATVGRTEFEARHLFGALIEKGAVTDQTRRLFEVELAPNDLTALQVLFVDRIMGAPAAGETRESWLKALHLQPNNSVPDSTNGGATPEREPVERVTGFSPDNVERSSDDLLQTASDARALARLICLEDAAPLAIAIFGGWGSGKSTFMGRIDAEVRSIAKAQAASIDESTPSIEHAARFVRRVVQIRFNAWQFVDANLWASLTAEFFDQLRAGGWERVSGARYAGLVERVNHHVHSLSADAEATRRAAAGGGKDLRKAQQNRDEAARVACNAAGHILGQAAIDTLGAAYESQKASLAALGLEAGVDSGRAVDAILDVVRSSRSILGQTLAVLRVICKSPARARLAAISAFVLLLTAVLWIIFRRGSWTHIAAAVIALGAVGEFCSALAPALRVVRGVAKRSAEIAQAVELADKDALKALLSSEIELRKATAEAEALQAAADQASQRLSRYMNPSGPPNPPRLLRYVLEDDPNTKALTAEIGLAGRTRRLFQAVDDIVREERSKPIAEKLDGEVPDRIVLYIDDLDRCTEDQVYAVLQAIHLLLAFELFVVVVGVDVTWVQNALAKAFGDNGSKDGQAILESQRAAQYLEKIFQIAFWLEPLTSDGTQGGSFARYVRALSGSRRAEARAPALGSAEKADDDHASEPPPVSDPADAPDPHASGAKTGDAGTSLEREQTRTALATIQLESEEIEFLASSTIAKIAAKTPRAVKRLVNVYRLVRTRLSETNALDSGDGPRSPDYPLIALMVAVETGQPVDVADAFYDGLRLLGPREALCQDAFFKAPTGTVDQATLRLATAFAKSPDLKAAVEEVYRLRNNSLVAEDALRIAKIARRYSFNHYG
jgi:hypothetical protein